MYFWCFYKQRLQTKLILNSWSCLMNTGTPWVMFNNWSKLERIPQNSLWPSSEVTTSRPPLQLHDCILGALTWCSFTTVCSTPWSQDWCFMIYFFLPRNRHLVQVFSSYLKCFIDWTTCHFNCQWFWAASLALCYKIRLKTILLYLIHNIAILFTDAYFSSISSVISNWFLYLLILINIHGNWSNLENTNRKLKKTPQFKLTITFILKIFNY